MTECAFCDRVTVSLRGSVAGTGEGKKDKVKREGIFVVRGGSGSVRLLHSALVILIWKEVLYFLFLFSNELFGKGFFYFNLI